MAKTILVLILGLTFSFSAEAATVYWTGQSNYGQSVTGQSVINCQYQYAGKFFWKTFVSSFCPYSIEIY